MKNRNSYIWSMDCIAICTVLGLTLDARQIDKLCRKHDLHNSKADLNTAYGFYLLHKSCHKERAVVPKRLNKFLNERFAGIVRIVRNMTCSSESELVDKVEPWVEKEPAGIIWALLTDPRATLQHHGVYLVHRVSYAAFRESQRRITTAAEDAGAMASTERKLQQLRCRLEKHQSTTEDLRKRLAQAEQRAMALQVTCDRQQRQIADFEARPERESQMRRRIRMLEHELEQARPRPIEVDTQSPGCSVVSCESDEEAAPPCAVERSAPSAPVGCSDCSPCSLDNLRVAVIGGLDRLEPHYRRVVEDLGARFCFHNGDCHGGCQVLKNVVCQSDIVMFITRVNSHSAMHVVKGLCKKSGKRFTVLRETSPRALARALPRTA